MGVDSSSPSRMRRTAAKLIRVLEQVASTPAGSDARSIAQALGVSISTAYDLLNTLGELGYVQRQSRGCRYILGGRTFVLWCRFLRQGGIAPLIRPALLQLAQAAQARVYTAVYYDREVVIVDAVGRDVDRVPKVPVGTSVPAHALAVGKAVLAHLPRAELARYLEAHRLQRFTPATITERRALSLELANIRLYGVAFDRQEYSEDLACVAAPVCDPAGHVLAAVGIAVSPTRLPDEERSLAVAVKEAAELASWRLRELASEPTLPQRDRRTANQRPAYAATCPEELDEFFTVRLLLLQHRGQQPYGGEVSTAL